MASYGDDNLRASHCLAWNSWDDLDSAEWQFFDNREECKTFAQNKVDSGTRYLWMAELGRYVNTRGSLVTDWMYCWWYGASIDAGQPPAAGTGVPEDKASWDYQVEYVPLQPVVQLDSNGAN